MSDDLFSLFGFAFAQPKEVRPALTVDLASDIPAQQFIRALKECGLTIAEQEGTQRLLICKAPPKEPAGLVWGGPKKSRRSKRGN
jgi:hypothetical protein